MQGCRVETGPFPQRQSTVEGQFNARRPIAAMVPVLNLERKIVIAGQQTMVVLKYRKSSLAMPGSGAVHTGYLLIAAGKGRDTKR